MTSPPHPSQPLERAAQPLPPGERGYVDILGVPVHDVTLNEACEVAERLIAQGGAHQFATVNPEFIMAARRDAEFMRVLNVTALNVPDGVGVLWAARRKGYALRERVAGVELLEKLCAMASTHGWRAYFLGARPGVAERAAAAMALKYPGLIIAGTFAGSPRVEDEAAIVARVREARPHLLFAAYGAPQQDVWLAHVMPRLVQVPPHPMAPQRATYPLLLSVSRRMGEGVGMIGMGVGGAFDFIAGVQQRAPDWMRKAGLEWLYRLARQPWRWRRQTALVRFALAAMLESH